MERSRKLLIPVLVALSWAGLLVVTVAPVALLFTLPVFLIAAPLAIGRYPALDLITPVRRARPRQRPAVKLAPPEGDPLPPVRPLAAAPFVRGPPAPHAAA